MSETLFHLTEEAGIPALVVSGRIGPGELQRFDAALADLCDRCKDCVILNMEACPYLPSMAIPPLIRSDLRLTSDGKNMILVATGELLDILRVLRLDRKLRIRDSLDECVREALTLSA